MKNNLKRPGQPTAPAQTEDLAEVVATTLAVREAQANPEEKPDEDKARLGKGLSAMLKGAVNDMHFYGVITDAEAVSIKERIDAKS